MAKSRNQHYLLIASAVILLDQAVKFLVSITLPYQRSVTLIPHILSLTYTTNTGAGFSVLTGRNALIIFAVTAIIGAMLYFFDRWSKPEKLFAALIIAGALGNLIDRILRGHVIDFIDLGIWPVFNVADSAVTIGVCGLLYYSFKKK
jgi:signal peptidase II